MKFNPWTVALLGLGIVSIPPLHSRGEAEFRADSSRKQDPQRLCRHVGAVESRQWQSKPSALRLGGTGKADGFNLNVVELRLDKPFEAADVGAQAITST